MFLEQGWFLFFFIWKFFFEVDISLKEVLWLFNLLLFWSMISFLFLFNYLMDDIGYFKYCLWIMGVWVR